MKPNIEVLARFCQGQFQTSVTTIWNLDMNVEIHSMAPQDQRAQKLQGFNTQNC